VATSSSSSASAKRVARLAQRGKGKKVRFQGGTLFPVAVLLVLLLGLLTIFYARQSRPDPGTQPPQIGDHWHAAYGMYVCDTWLPKLQGTLEDQTIDPQTGNKVYKNEGFGTTGIHSHGDGVIHYHPYYSKAVGNRAVLGLFLDNYSVKLSDTELKLPADQGGDDYKVGQFKCNGQDVAVSVVVWDSYADTGPGTTYVTGFHNLRIKKNGMVFVIAVVPKGTKVPMPPWAQDLPSLGAADSGATTPTTTATGSATGSSTPDTGSATTVAGSATTVAGASTTAGSATTVAGPSTTAGSATTVTSSATTAGASTTSGG
jgi:hypothetical protein